jgi:hypothetical protein
MSIQITDERLVQRIQQIARRERRAPAQVIADALEAYEIKDSATSTQSFLLAISDLGTSGQEDVAERDEDILAAEIDLLTGWSADFAGGRAGFAHT